mmetsp:Transcript_39243/g.95977  ORF Transcript_39243/g.95977 Transcript_39243/m.95977 type:complete len:200 (-) Transcript_39243:465-1064(-)
MESHQTARLSPRTRRIHPKRPPTGTGFEPRPPKAQGTRKVTTHLNSNPRNGAVLDPRAAAQLPQSGLKHALGRACGGGPKKSVWQRIQPGPAALWTSKWPMHHYCIRPRRVPYPGLQYRWETELQRSHWVLHTRRLSATAFPCYLLGTNKTLGAHPGDQRRLRLNSEYNSRTAPRQQPGCPFLQGASEQPPALRSPSFV